MEYWSGDLILLAFLIVTILIRNRNRNVKKRKVVKVISTQTPSCLATKNQATQICLDCLHKHDLLDYKIKILDYALDKLGNLVDQSGQTVKENWNNNKGLLNSRIYESSIDQLEHILSLKDFKMCSCENLF